MGAIIGCLGHLRKQTASERSPQKTTSFVIRPSPPRVMMCVWSAAWGTPCSELRE